MVSARPDALRASGGHRVPVPKRWETWEGALLHFGYTPEQVAERLEQQ